MTSSTDDNSSSLQARLQQLREAYAGQLPEKLRAIAEAAQDFVATGRAEALESAHRLAHNLAGSGATYGFVSVSRAARDLELHLKEHLNFQNENANDGAARRVQTLLFLQTLQDVVTEVAREYSHSEYSKDAGAAKVSSDVPNRALPSVNAPPMRKSRRALPAMCAERPVYIVTRDFDGSLEISRQLDSYGFAMTIFGTAPQQNLSEVALELREAMRARQPLALVVDTALEDEARSQGFSFAGIAREFDAARGYDEETPLVFISDRGDMAARLAAVRAGGQAYFVKPVNISELVDWLDGCAALHLAEAYRVLVVDDDEVMNEYLVRVLHDADMMAQAVREPLRVIDAINEFRPDLILVDLNMPLCSGQELARVIRQQPDYVGIPIVFLSAETDLATQLGALSLGGDDFLTKPLQPQHLVQAVAARVRRARELRALMTRDSLTGLLNHTAIKERLEQEVARALRENSTLSLAMLDIDFFKKINDVHGHPIGDRVIKSLARLLQQRLRQSDLIGRYGGEEFAVILPGASREAAMRVLEPMREGFARLRHGAPGHEFNVTFSAGIATLPPCETASSLTDTADRALYEAKNNGRTAWKRGAKRIKPATHSIEYSNSFCKMFKTIPPWV